MLPDDPGGGGQFVIHQNGEGPVAVVIRPQAVGDPHHPIGSGPPGLEFTESPTVKIDLVTTPEEAGMR
jgi:hypothetical protein